MPVRRFINGSTLIKIVLFSILLLILLFSWDAINQVDIKAWILMPRDWWVTMSLIIGLSMIKSVLFFLPIQLIYITSGIMFSMKAAILLCLVGLMIEITLTYYFGKWAGSKAVDGLVAKNDKLRKWFSLYKTNEFSGIFWARLAPLSVEAVSLVLGAANAKYERYIIASLLGSFPKIVLFILVGTFISQVQVSLNVVMFLISVCVWMLLVIYLMRSGRILFRRKKSGEPLPADQDSV